MKIRVVFPYAEITQTSYRRHDKKGKEIPIQYYEVSDTREIDLDKMLSSYNQWQDEVVQSGKVPAMLFSAWVIAKLGMRNYGKTD